MQRNGREHCTQRPTGTGKARKSEAFLGREPFGWRSQVLLLMASQLFQVFATISLLHPAAHLLRYLPVGVFHVRRALVYPSGNGDHLALVKANRPHPSPLLVFSCVAFDKKHDGIRSRHSSGGNGR